MTKEEKGITIEQLDGLEKLLSKIDPNNKIFKETKKIIKEKKVFDKKKESKQKSIDNT